MLMLMLMASTVICSAAPAAAQSSRVQRPDLAAVEAQVVERTNAFRRRSGASALTTETRLAEAARSFADYMARTDRYGHQADGRRPSERAQASGYAYCMVAENIGYQYSSRGFATDELATRLVEEWENSPGHRKNMLLPVGTEIGVGVAQSAQSQRYYAVQLFGRPKSASARFSIVNRSDADVRYQLDGQSFDLPPRVTRTHEGCFDGALQMLWPEGARSPPFEPSDGARYAVVRDPSGQLRLQP